MKPTKVPMPWAWYMGHSDEQRHAWYLAWCAQHDLDADTAQAAEAWVDLVPTNSTELRAWARATGIKIPRTLEFELPLDEDSDVEDDKYSNLD